MYDLNQARNKKLKCFTLTRLLPALSLARIHTEGIWWKKKWTKEIVVLKKNYYIHTRKYLLGSYSTICVIFLKLFEDWSDWKIKIEFTYYNLNFPKIFTENIFVILFAGNSVSRLTFVWMSVGFSHEWTRDYKFHKLENILREIISPLFSYLC